MVRILDGKKLSIKILKKIKKEIKEKRLKLSLVVILIGGKEESLLYIRQKEKRAKEIGISFRIKRFCEEISFYKLKEEINKIVLEKPTGIIIQLPLPLLLKKKQDEILSLIPREQDVDVLGRDSRKKIGVKSATNILLPPVVAGILRLLKEYKVGLKNKKIIITGKGFLVGAPLISYLKTRGYDVGAVDEFTSDLKSKTLTADILITATGGAGLIKGDMLKNNVAVVDAGIKKVGDSFFGDVDFKSASEKASFITPVPGGVGPMTVAMIFNNLLKLAGFKKTSI